MKELSIKKKLTIIRLYFSGLSYDRIANKALVSKGAVSNVASELKAGELHPSLTVVDDIETLRELSVSLRKHSLVPTQALLGITVLNMLREMNIEPSQIQNCFNLYSELIEKKPDMESLLKVATELNESYDNTGLTFSELEVKYNDLTSEVARLTPLAKQVQKQKELISKQTKNLKELEHEITKKASKHTTLNQSIAKKEKREEELIKKIIALEDKVFNIEERCKASVQKLDRLSALGITPEELPSVTNMIERIATRHGIKSVTIVDKVLSELGELDTRLDLDETIKTKRHELTDIRRTIKREKTEYQRLNITNKQLEKEQIENKAFLEEQRRYHNEQIALANSVFNQEIKYFHTRLSEAVSSSIERINELKNLAHKVGKEEADFKKAMEANVFVSDLMSIALGNFNGPASSMKQTSLVFLHGSHTWLSQNKKAFDVNIFLLNHMNQTIEYLQLWRPESTE